MKIDRQITTGAVFYLAVVAVWFVSAVYPHELNLVLDSLFWASAVLFVYSWFIVIFLFRTSGGSTLNVRFAFGLALILSATLVYGGWSESAHNFEQWRPFFLPKSYANLYVWLEILVRYGKDMASFGLGAIGAALVADAILKPKNAVSN